MPSYVSTPPDLPALADASQIVTDNFRRFANLPAVDGGAAILTAVNSLQEQVQQIQQQMAQMQQQMAQMQQQMQQMETRILTRISSSDANNLARLANSQLTSPQHGLIPLRSTTNTLIDNFPATPAALATLSQASLTNLLTALGEDPNGSIGVKRQRFRRALGLKEAAV
ncbi:hypothetical protein AC579_719 [Pseudocercospora musae]|uniref:Uncharacterized protein n=1 Tax=Pseudocercospora musae TaxID=113226 RepID=A0A139I4R0_9PEZI|nr:hypothetical protein AC579_719 [Pseudocercospora musae]